jgi:hypothetical protein
MTSQFLDQTDTKNFLIDGMIKDVEFDKGKIYFSAHAHLR